MKIPRNNRLAPIVFTLLIALCVSSTAFPHRSGQAAQLSVVATSAPKYPPIALTVRLKGIVVVEVNVDSKGDVVSAKAVEGHALLRRSAEDAAKLWKFNPASGPASRTANLTFAFDFQAEESTDTRDEAVYVPPYRIELTRKIATIAPLPPLALLPRLDGRIPEQKCLLHNEVMQLDIVPIEYGLPPARIEYAKVDVISFFRGTWDDLTHRESYREASFKKFPNSNMTAGGGCIVGEEQKAEVLYCPKCRAVEMKWRKSHPGKGPSVVAVISGS
jgi:TonB family protein